MREIRTSGSAGALGEQSPGATQKKGLWPLHVTAPTQFRCQRRAPPLPVDGRRDLGQFCDLGLKRTLLLPRRRIVMHPSQTISGGTIGTSAGSFSPEQWLRLFSVSEDDL